MAGRAASLLARGCARASRTASGCRHITEGETTEAAGNVRAARVLLLIASQVTESVRRTARSSEGESAMEFISYRWTDGTEREFVLVRVQGTGAAPYTF